MNITKLALFCCVGVALATVAPAQYGKENWPEHLADSTYGYPPDSDSDGGTPDGGDDSGHDGSGSFDNISGGGGNKPSCNTCHATSSGFRQRGHVNYRQLTAKSGELWKAHAVVVKHVKNSRAFSRIKPKNKLSRDARKLIATHPTYKRD